MAGTSLIPRNPYLREVAGMVEQDEGEGQKLIVLNGVDGEEEKAVSHVGDDAPHRPLPHKAETRNQQNAIHPIIKLDNHGQKKKWDEEEGVPRTGDRTPA